MLPCSKATRFLRSTQLTHWKLSWPFSAPTRCTSMTATKAVLSSGQSIASPDSSRRNRRKRSLTPRLKLFIFVQSRVNHPLRVLVARYRLPSMKNVGVTVTSFFSPSSRNPTSFFMIDESASSLLNAAFPIPRLSATLNRMGSSGRILMLLSAMI